MEDIQPKKVRVTREWAESLSSRKNHLFPSDAVFFGFCH